MKKISVFLLLFALSCTAVFAAGNNEASTLIEEKILFTDSCGRTVEIPKDITKVAPSGNVATMFFSVLAPQYMVCVNKTPDSKSMQYLPKVLAEIPEAGQLYGGKATLNIEQIIALDAQIIIDIGDYKKGIEEDLDALQQQTGIPCIFMDGSIANMAESIRKLGGILKDKQQRAEEVASFIDGTLAMTEENKAKIKPEEVKTVMFSGGKDGLGTNAKGSSQAQVLEITGCENAIVLDKVVSKGNGNQINMEQLYAFDPDVIVISEDSYFDNIAEDETWSVLKAVQNGSYYEVPAYPYNWLANPPSLNMILGIWWLGNKVYPQYYDYNMDEVADRIYNLFWGCNYDC